MKDVLFQFYRGTDGRRRRSTSFSCMVTELMGFLALALLKSINPTHMILHPTDARTAREGVPIASFPSLCLLLPTTVSESTIFPAFPSPSSCRPHSIHHRQLPSLSNQLLQLINTLPLPFLPPSPFHTRHRHPPSPPPPVSCLS